MKRIFARVTWKPVLGLAVLLAAAALVWAVDTNNNGIEDEYEAFFGLIATNATEAAMDYDADDLSNLDESLIWTDPLNQDTDRDGFVDGVDSNPLSRAAFHWGDSQFTSGNNYQYTGPAWTLWGGKDGGEWVSNSWQVADTESNGVGQLNMRVDRASLTNNLMLDVRLEKVANASLYVDLTDTNDSVVLANLFGNISSGTGQIEVTRLAIPLISNETATGIRLQRGTGPVTVFESSLYIDEDGDGVDADQEKQIGTSDYSSDTYQDGTNDWSRAFVKIPAEIILGDLNQNYDGNPHAVSVSTSPTGLPVMVTYNALTNAPVNAGQYAVTARVVAATYEGLTNGTLEIQAAAQIIDFASTTTGRWVNLQASASSGLPVTYSVSGHAAVLLGDRLYFVRSGSVDVFTSQAGNNDWQAVVVTNTVSNTNATPAAGWVIAWGWNFWEQVDVPDSLTYALAVAGGWGYSIALKPDGNLQVWGRNDQGECNVPTNIGPSVAIGAGFWHGLAVQTNGTVATWGDNSQGQCNVPVGLSNVVAVAGGEWHSLALREGGTVAAWGNDNYGQLEVPDGLSNVVAIAAGAIHSLALRSDGTVATWGDNSHDQCDIPVGLSNVIAIAGTYYQSVALKADGTCAVWGNDDCLPQTGRSNLVAIAAQFAFVGQQPDGHLLVYSTNSLATNVPDYVTNVLAFSAGGAHVLATVSPATFQGRVAKPVVHPASSNYVGAIQVTISCVSTDAAIHYTTDNSNPTVNSAVYTNALTFINSVTIKARGFKAGYIPSATGVGQLNRLAELDGDDDGFDDEWELKWGLSATELPSGADLSGWWRLDEVAGGIASDSCNTPHDGTVSNGLWSTNTFLSHGCLSLNGSNSIVVVGNTPRLGDSNLTASAFVNFTARYGNHVSGAASNGFMTILYRQSSGTQPAFTICKTERNSLLFQVKGTSGSAIAIETGDDIVEDGQWFHCAGVVSNGLALFYVNGEKIGERNISGTVDYDTAGLFSMNASGQADDGNFWGRLDEVRLYKVALTSNQVKFLCRPLTDLDEDGIYFYEEYVLGTDPNSPDASADSDGDDLPDDWEIEHFGSIGAYDWNDDPDGDGLDNLAEYLAGSDPMIPDADHDGLPDGVDADPSVYDSTPPTFTITEPTEGMVIQ